MTVKATALKTGSVIEVKAHKVWVEVVQVDDMMVQYKLRDGRKIWCLIEDVVRVSQNPVRS